MDDNSKRGGEGPRVIVAAFPVPVGCCCEARGASSGPAVTRGTSVGGGSQAYNEGWEHVFGRQAAGSRASN